MKIKTNIRAGLGLRVAGGCGGGGPVKPPVGGGRIGGFCGGTGPRPLPLLQ